MLVSCPEEDVKPDPNAVDPETDPDVDPDELDPDEAPIDWALCEHPAKATPAASDNPKNALLRMS